MKQKKSIFLGIALLAIATLTVKILIAHALTGTLLHKPFSTFKDTINSADVVAATSVDGDNSYKRLVVHTLGAGEEITHVVNNITAIFQEPTNNAIDIVNIYVEDANGNKLSTGNLSHVPVSLNQNGTYLENRPADAKEIGFYDENNQTFLVYYIKCSYDCNLNNLSQGQFIAYIQSSHP